MTEENTVKMGEVQEEKKEAALVVKAAETMALEVETKTFNNLYKLSEIFSKSKLVPTSYQGKKEDVFVAVMMGREVGLQPMQALQNIAVINGRPCVWGDAALALVKASGLLEYIVETPPTKDKPFATCTVKRKTEPNEVSRTFSWDDAERAGLKNKAGTWKQYPARMMQMRARAFALRDVFPDVLKGMHIGEEVMDLPTTKMEPKIQMPQRTAPVETYVPETQGAVVNDAVISEAQLKRLFAISHDAGYKSEEVSTFIKEHFDLEHMNELKVSDYEDAINLINVKADEAANAK